MWNGKKTVVVMTLVSLAFGPLGSARTARSRSENHPTALELLDKYAETQDKLKSVIIKGETHYPSFDIRANGRKTVYEPRSAFEFRSDGKRACLRQREWGRIGGRNVKKEDPWYRSCLWDGKYYYRYGGRLWIEMENPVRQNDNRFRAGVLAGYFWDDYAAERVDSTLRRSRRISVRDRLERVGGSQCYVIDAVTERGKYTLWIDPRHGYNIAKIQNLKKEGDLFRVMPMDEELHRHLVGKGGSFYVCVQNVRFEKNKDTWVPMEAEVKYNFDTPGDRIVHFEGKKHIKRTQVILNPDHDAMGSFIPDDIPSGTEIAGIKWSRSTLIRNDPYKDWEDYWEFRWLPGAKSVTNESGRVVANTPDKYLPLLAKVLRAKRLAKDFELRPAGLAAKGKKMLLCFWDVKQEGSQQVLLKLRERQEALAQKGVVVVAVEASGTKSDEVDSWINNNKPSFAVGTYYAVYEDFLRRSQEDRDKEKPVLSDIVSDVNIAWQIEKLPWLILADRNQVVAAEGFELDELDQKIKDAEEAEAVTKKIAHLASEED